MGPRGQGIGRGVRDRFASGVLSNDPERDRIYNRVLDQNADPEWQMTMLDAMDQVPVEHLRELYSISPDLAYMSMWTDRGWGYEDMSGTQTAAGLYSSAFRAIAVHGTHTGALGRSIAIHEIGHHQDYLRRTQSRFKTYDRDYAWTRQMVAERVLPKYRELPRLDRAQMGMTEYAATNVGEFMSEAYVAWHRATPEQWGRLSSFVDEHTGGASTGTHPFSGVFEVAGGD